jgi:hypothetical protein
MQSSLQRMAARETIHRAPEKTILGFFEHVTWQASGLLEGEAVELNTCSSRSPNLMSRSAGDCGKCLLSQFLFAANQQFDF